MAIQELTQPIINPIAAFDSTKEHEITFIVIGGAQVTGNRIVISDNQTGNVVYNNIVNTMKLAHTIPANTLSNGGYYNAVIYTIDNSANESVPSTPVPFYCYSQPTLTITNIPATETIGNGTYKFQGNYLQAESEQLNSYQFILYDSNKDILDRSDIIYYQSNSSLAYTFVGMDNDTSYYVELKGQTVNNTEITSGLMYFTVRYTQPATFAIVDLINDCENGYIQISSNIVAIDGKSNPEPPIYIDDKEVDLRDKDSWVKWDEGFNINNDFTMRVWGRDFNDYERIISLANKENTPDNPNKIEMKWMIADVIETLPSYTSVSGKNVAIKNGFKTDIEDLEIMGNSEQISKAPVDLGTGNYIKAETTRDMYLDIDVYGNQYQATREESKSTVTGTEITVNDTYINNQTKFNIDGNSEQKQYEGYNLLGLDYDNIAPKNCTCSRNGNVLILTSTTTNNIAVSIPLIRELPIGTYTLNSNVSVSEATQLRLDNTFGTVVGNFGTTYSNKSITTTDISKAIVFNFGNNSIGNTYTVDLSSAMLLKDTYTAENIPTYEPYVGGQPSPNPEYPQEVEVIDGVNLFDKDNVRAGYRLGSDGAYFPDSSYSATELKRVEQNTTYQTSWQIQLMKCICTYDNNENFIRRIFNDSYSFTTTSNEYYIRADVSNDLLETAQITKGTTPKPYLPHGCIGLEQSGKNYCTSSWEIGTISSTYGLPTVSSNRLRTKDYNDIEPSKEYTYNLSGNYSDGIVFEYDENKNFIKTSNWQKIPYTFTTLDNTRYLKLVFKNNDKTMTLDDLIKCEIYETGKEPKIHPINLNGNTIAKVGDVKDLLKIYRNGDVEIEKKRNRYVFDGNENYIFSQSNYDTANTNCFRVNLPKKFKKASSQWALTGAKCNYFIEKYWQSIYGAKEDEECFGFTIDNNENMFIKISNTMAQDLNTFKTWLLNLYNAGTPVYIDYQLATPETIKLPSIEPIELWEGTNNFKLITNLDTEMELEYNYIPQSPSPEAPSEIETVGQNVNELANLIETQVISGVEVTKNDNGSLTFNGTATKGISININNKVGEYFNCISGTNYTISLKNNNGLYFRLRKVSENTNIAAFDTPSKGITFESNYTGDCFAYLVIIEGTTFNNLTIYPKIEKGSKATPYSPYGQGSAELKLCNKNLLNMQEYAVWWNNAKVLCKSNQIIFLGNSSGNLGMDYNSKKEDLKIKAKTKLIYSSKYKSGECSNGNTYYNLKLFFDDGTSKQYNMNRSLSDYKTSKSVQIVLEKDVIAYQISGSGYQMSGLKSELIYEFQLEIGEVSTDIEEHKEQSYIMPLQKEFCKIGDYIDTFVKVDGKWYEKHLIGKKVFDGTESFNKTVYETISQFNYYNTNIKKATSSDNVSVLSNYFKTTNTWNSSWTKDNLVVLYVANNAIRFQTSLYDTVEDFKTWLKSKYDEGNPVVIYYKLEKPINLELTSGQKAIQSTLKPAYADITNIYATEDLPILKVSTLRVPSPSVPSPIYSSGDQRNLLEDLGLFDISYTQDYFKVTDTTFKLKPNFVYNLSFDYTINNASTDLYFTVCYKNGNDITDITGAVLYYNQATGRSNTSFMVPEDIPNNSTLSVKFVRTLIPANVNVSISNVQLEKGRVAHDYQKHGLYNIYPTATQKNIFDYDKIYYVENKNTEISYIQNGISANLAGTNETAYIAIGFPNILQPGQNYAISYNSYGELLSSKLYTMNKETGERVKEITLDNGSFTAPSNVYDFLFEFTLNDTIENNQVQIWNIQIETGDQVTEYEVYKPNQTTITLDQPLRAIGNYKDIICLESPNLLNPQTQIANVKGGQDYYFSQSGNTQYQLNYLTEYGNLISSVSMVSGRITVPYTCVQIKVNALSSDITSNKLQINEGTTAEIYYPYVNEPSVIRYCNEIILNGNENWNVSQYGINTYSLVVENMRTVNWDIICAISNNFNGVSYNNRTTAENNIIYTDQNSMIGINIRNTEYSTLSDWKIWLKSKYDSGNPVVIEYVLYNPLVYSISSENVSALKGLKTYNVDSNVFTNNNMPANINFSYISGQSEQEAKNAYITLKCWNGNVMPYFVHSNYIDIPKETDKVFIWVRKKNNIFDLKIENLGDYQGEET